MATEERVSRWSLGIVLTAALMALSSSAVIVRGIGETPPLVVALWRCVGSAAVLSFAVRSLPARRDAGAITFGGLCLAIHFVAWFASLDRTSVLHSTVLVCLSPLWVGFAEAWIEGRWPSRGFLLGAAGAVVGLGLMAEDGGTGVTWQGDALALFAGVLAAAYLLVGRHVRGRVDLPTYAATVTGAAGAALLVAAWASATPLAVAEPRDAWLVAACVVGPQLVGHNGVAWALRHLPASTVSTLILLEPVGATWLAAWAFGEVPSPRAALGGLVVVAGVVVGARR